MRAESTIIALGRATALYERAAFFQGRSRERLLALAEADELFFRLYPYHYRSLQLVRVASQLSRGAENSTDHLRRCESRMVALLTGVIGAAQQCGDLVLPARPQTGELAFSLWALVFGTRALLNTSVATVQLGIHAGFDVTRDTIALLLDSLGWRPLTMEWDYTATQVRIRHELFAQEWQEALVA